MTTITRNLNDQVKTSTLWPTRKPSASTPPSYCNIIRNYNPLGPSRLNISNVIQTQVYHNNNYVYGINLNSRPFCGRHKESPLNSSSARYRTCVNVNRSSELHKRQNSFVIVNDKNQVAYKYISNC